MSNGNVVNVNNNSITGLTLNGTGTAPVSGVLVIGAATNTVNVFKNKICNLLRDGAAGGDGVCNGLLFSSGSVLNAYDNFIGDLRAPLTSQLDAVRGISFTFIGGQNYNVYYNTVYLNALSSGSVFGTSGVFATGSASATAGVLDLRNNIIDNVSVPNGAGLTVAYRRSSTALANYAASSNNNDFYAGAPNASHLIFFDGTNSDQTLASYAGRVAPRDAGSISENPPFLSTSCGDPNFLHINSSIATQVESSAVNIGGITDDFDNDIRQGNSGYSGTGTAPDIGADEFGGITAPTATPGPTPTPTGTPTPTPTPTPTFPPGLPEVSAPVFSMGTSDGFAVNNQPITTTLINASSNYIGFQADLIFDSAVAVPSPATAPVAASGLNCRRRMDCRWQRHQYWARNDEDFACHWLLERRKDTAERLGSALPYSLETGKQYRGSFNVVGLESISKRF